MREIDKLQSEPAVVQEVVGLERDHLNMILAIPLSEMNNSTYQLPSASDGLEQRNQDKYLNNFGLNRRHILGDGNCLFRAISFGLFGTEDQHSHLRGLAISFIRDHRDEFQNYFIPSRAGDNADTFMTQQLDRLSMDGVYAGHESVVALGRHFGINVHITLGGDVRNPIVSTISIDPVNEELANIHIIYSSFGGGHYDIALQHNLDANRFPNIPAIITNSQVNTREIHQVQPVNDTMDSERAIKILSEASGVKTVVAGTPSQNTTMQQDIDSATNPTSKMVFKCKYCSVVYSDSNYLESHVISTHPNGSMSTLGQYHCDICSKTLKSKFSLNRHHSLKHQNQKTTHTDKNSVSDGKVTSATGIFQCTLCSKILKSKFSLNRHVQLIHHLQQTSKVNSSDALLSLDVNDSCCTRATGKLTSESQETTENVELQSDNIVSANKTRQSQHLNKPKTYRAVISCLVSRCQARYYTVTAMMNHLSRHHKVDFPTTDLVFNTFEDFCSWKEDEEMKNNVFFMKPRKEFKRKSFTYAQYVCNRSGKRQQIKKVSAKGNSRKNNIKGSCRLNQICPARMCVRSYDNSNRVCVKYTHTHTHQTTLDQTKFTPIPRSIKQEIKTKVSLGVPTNVILKQIRGDAGKLQNREGFTYQKHHLIDRKLIKSLEKQHINVTKTRNASDATSISMIVKELQSESYNPILYFKHQNEDNSTSLQKKDFMLIFMSREQKYMYELFAPRIICIDSTHGTNSYDFKLVTIVVVDEYKKGYPVAFCICNREDEIAMRLFLKHVRNACPKTSVTTLMTDDDLSVVSAAKAVFGNDIAHYLCIWHVQRSWDRNLNKLNSRQNRDVFKDRLSSLMYSKSELDYQTCFKEFYDDYIDSENKFITYFDKFYASRPEKWCIAFRRKDLQTEIKTNNFVESYHKTLKRNFFDKGKYNRRVDDLLHYLMSLEQHYFMNRKRYTTYNIPSDFNSDTSNRHESSMQIEDRDVTTINENTFHVLSSDSTNHYTIVQESSTCSLTSCFLKCSKPPCVNLCQHLYTCSCPDLDHMCKHIHKVHSIRCSSEPYEDDVEAELSLSVTDICDQDQKSTTHKKDLFTFHQCLDQLSVDMLDPDMHGRLGFINSALKTILADNKAHKTMLGKPAPLLNRKRKIGPNQKLEKQQEFKRKKAKKTGSTKPYPPLRLQQQQSSGQQPSGNQNQDPFITDQGIRLPSNLQCPPNLYNQPIRVIDKNGKVMHIKISSGSHMADDVMDDP